MTISVGTRLGPYEIVAPIGSGGMGEVYRARDTRLDRQVAVKILPSEFAQNAQFRIRFEREAKTISQLNHPHICTLHDVGTDNGVEYLVMELLEGESLADKLAKGPLPLEQMLRHGIEIAEALDKAHKAGVVHRDLKPSNVMITKSGAKLLDFGLAKSGARLIDLEGATQHKPLTQEGTIVGTFQYMAPEQLEGEEADARTDIFALGTLLYEMATGKRAFEGKTKTSLIASIVSGEPKPMLQAQPLTPPALEHVVRKCLAKDRDDRWQSAHDIAEELRWIREAGSQAGVAAPVIIRRRTRERLAWGLAAALGIAAAAFAYSWYRATAEPPATVRSFILPPEKATFAFTPAAGAMAVSPDGRRIALLVSSEGKTMIWIRPLNGLAAQPLMGTEGAVFPFWSPDSRWVGFFAAGKLRKIDANGGPPQSLCEVGTQPRGGSWNREGTIIFAANTRDPISKVAAEGGAPAAVTALGKLEFSHRWPSFLPDGRHFLYFAQTWTGGASERNKVYIGSLDSSERWPLLHASSGALYAPPGYVVFPRERVLLAQRFDAKKLRLLGEAFPIAERVESFAGTTATLFSLSENGILAYQSGEGSTVSRLSWLDRSGKELEVVVPSGDYNHPRLSHDGRRVAYEQLDPHAGLADIWTFDLVRRVPTRLTFETAETSPVWSPDDQKIVYALTEPTGAFDLNEISSTGSAAAETLFKSSSLKFAGDWSFDGRAILFMNNDPMNKNGWDIWQLSPSDRSAAPVIASRFNEATPQLSPDGHWLAYVSDQSGQNDVYIEPFPPHGAKWQVSTGGGSQPRWRHDGKELFYRTPDDRLISVTINPTSQGLEISTPTPLFQIRLRSTSGIQYDVSADGKKFLMNVAKAQESASPVTLVTNWTAEMKK